MPLSIFLAQVIGSYAFLVSLAMLVQHAWFKKVSNDLLANTSLLTLCGMLSLITGLLIVVSHNVWVSEWPVLITLVGWILFIRGLLLLFTPNAYVRISKELMTNVGHTLLCWVRLAAGVVLIWAGFSNAA